jgi:hypothetical protein
MLKKLIMRTMFGEDWIMVRKDAAGNIQALKRTVMTLESLNAPGHVRTPRGQRKPHMKPNGWEKFLDEVETDAERDTARSRLELVTVTDFDKLGYHPTKEEIDAEVQRNRLRLSHPSPAKHKRNPRSKQQRHRVP